MSNLAQRSELARRLNMTDAQLDVIRRMCVHPDAPDDVLELYLAKCRNVGADPLDKLIFVIPRRQNVRDERSGEWRSEIRWTIQGSIDLFRSIAEQSGDYAGQLGPYWTADGKEWVDVWIGSEPPKACRIGVLRQSFREPLWVTGTYEYYVPRNAKGEPAPSAFWKGEKGAHQLAKCVEELALRKAFPRKLHGVYGDDEMQQAGRPAATLPNAPKREQQPLEEVADAEFRSAPDSRAVEGGSSAGTARPQGERQSLPAVADPSVTEVQSRSAMPDEYRRKAGIGAVKKLCATHGITDADYREILVGKFGPDRFRNDAGDIEPTSKVLNVGELEQLWLTINERTKQATGSQ